MFHNRSERGFGEGNILESAIEERGAKMRGWFTSLTILKRAEY